MTCCLHCFIFVLPAQGLIPQIPTTFYHTATLFGSVRRTIPQTFLVKITQTWLSFNHKRLQLSVCFPNCILVLLQCDYFWVRLGHSLMFYFILTILNIFFKWGPLLHSENGNKETFLTMACIKLSCMESYLSWEKIVKNVMFFVLSKFIIFSVYCVYTWAVNDLYTQCWRTCIYNICNKQGYIALTCGFLQICHFCLSIQSKIIFHI